MMFILCSTKTITNEHLLSANLTTREYDFVLPSAKITALIYSNRYLSLFSSKGEERGARRPQLKIIRPQPDDYQPVTSDALSMRGFDSYRPNDYQLGMTDECFFKWIILLLCIDNLIWYSNHILQNQTYVFFLACLLQVYFSCLSLSHCIL